MYSSRFFHRAWNWNWMFTPHLNVKIDVCWASVYLKFFSQSKVSTKTSDSAFLSGFLKSCQWDFSVCSDYLFKYVVKCVRPTFFAFSKYTVFVWGLNVNHWASSVFMCKLTLTKNLPFCLSYLPGSESTKNQHIQSTQDLTHEYFHPGLLDIIFREYGIVKDMPASRNKAEV